MKREQTYVKVRNVNNSCECSFSAAHYEFCWTLKPDIQVQTIVNTTHQRHSVWTESAARDIPMNINYEAAAKSLVTALQQHWEELSEPAKQVWIRRAKRAVAVALHDIAFYQEAADETGKPDVPDYQAASVEIQKIVNGACRDPEIRQKIKKNNTPDAVHMVDSVLGGHWAGRVIGAAFRDEELYTKTGETSETPGTLKRIYP